MNCPPLVKGISVFLLLTCLCAQNFRTNGVKAQEISPTEDSDKVSLDLRALARSERASERVKVTIQSKDVPGGSLDSLLLGHGGHITRRFQNFRSSVAELPARVVKALANRKELRFVSLDGESLLLGHVSMTTGADAVRVPTGPNTVGLDGRGIGIAMLDSGIDTNHTAFLDGNVLTSNGAAIGDGSIFLSLGVLIGDCVLIGDALKREVLVLDRQMLK